MRDILSEIIKNMPTNQEAEERPDDKDPKGWKNPLEIKDKKILYNKKDNKIKFKFNNQIKDLFRRQDKLNLDREMEVLEKERRLAIIQVKKRVWAWRRQQQQQRKWAEECLETVLRETRLKGRATIMEICTEISGEIIANSLILADRRLEEKNRRLENSRLRKAELLVKLEGKRERLEKADKCKEGFHVKLTMGLILESVLDNVNEEATKNTKTNCLCITEEVIEKSIVTGVKRLEEKSKRLELARLKSMTARLSFLRVGAEGSPTRGKKRRKTLEYDDNSASSAKKVKVKKNGISTKKVWKKKANGLYGWVTESKSAKENTELKFLTNYFSFGGKSDSSQGGQNNKLGVQLGIRNEIASADQDITVDGLPDGEGPSRN